MNRGRGRPRNRGMLSLLALQVASQFYQLERKPPVTAGLIAANTLIYLRPGVLDDVLPPLSEVCLNPYLVLKSDYAHPMSLPLGRDNKIQLEGIVMYILWIKMANFLEQDLIILAFFLRSHYCSKLALKWDRLLMAVVYYLLLCCGLLRFLLNIILTLTRYKMDQRFNIDLDFDIFENGALPGTMHMDRDVKRLFLSAFYHVDESHLVYNMLSLLWKGVQLERMMGSTEFASMVALLLGLSHGIVVVLAKLLATFFDYPYALISECAVGFSAVLFALKVVLNSNSPNYANVYGVLVPARHAAWAELLLIQMFVPGVSFLGHLSGIFAGLLYLRLQRFFPGSNPLYPIIRKVTAIMGWPLRFLRGHLNRYSRRIFGHGTVGGRAVPHRTVGGRGARTAENGNAVWRCSLCAFDNSIHLEVCEMCGTRRGDNDLSPLAPPLLPTAPTVVSRDLSLEELRRLRLERFNRQ
eukprot:Gb_38761 [translate_table: standard]